ncbi:hypothetical protein ABB27_14580 [Stenotrophomonas terrae]|uniref:Uncharacterized protein n=1 Tax=Stenotrophomonas terrae TaxID=405446 RepID=A0A0R0CJM6_9GAMM|nr:hypothetical protein ABB27_14580 [Stenotrophomonas terrae]
MSYQLDVINLFLKLRPPDSNNWVSIADLMLAKQRRKGSFVGLYNDTKARRSQPIGPHSIKLELRGFAPNLADDALLSNQQNCKLVIPTRITC